MHIEQVLGDVPRDERCSCRDKPNKQVTVEPSIFRRIFGLS